MFGRLGESVFGATPPVLVGIHGSGDCGDRSGNQKTMKKINTKVFNPFGNF
jgi:hypothetical protein